MSIPNLRSDYYAEVTRLRAELADTREELRRMRQAFASPIPFPPSWRLTKTQQAMLHGLFMAPDGYLSHAALHSLTFRGSDGSDVKMVHVYICKIRAKLRGLGVSIINHHGLGYWLTPESNAVIEAALKQEGAR